MHRYTQLRTYIHAYRTVLTTANRFIHIHVQIYIHMYTHMHRYIDTHTYIPTYMYDSIRKALL